MEPENRGTGERSRTILVADDQAIILRFVLKVLQRSGYTVLTAESGEEALMQAGGFAGEIDLLLSNIQMPGMTGMELGTRVVRDRPSVKIVMMAGFRSGMLVLDDSWHFLQKPFIPAQLRCIIARMLRLPPNRLLNEPPLPDLQKLATAPGPGKTGDEAVGGA